MYQGNLTDNHIKRDSWVKDIRKNFNPETLADLIKKRIEFPHSTGPFIRHDSDEEPSDIVDAFISQDEEYRNKLTPAVGLLLYRMLHDKIKEDHNLLRGVFSIIKESKLIECQKLVYTWLCKKWQDDDLDSSNSRWCATYRDGLMAFARIQSKGDKEIEKWWQSIWNDDSSIWWAAAFLGLRIQNPDIACKELPLLINRGVDKASYLLVGMWNDEDSRSKMEDAIKRGLDSNSGWAGLALNMLLEKLSEPDRNKLMLNLKTLSAAN